MVTDRVFAVKWLALTLAVSSTALIAATVTLNALAQPRPTLSEWFSEEEIEALGLDTLSGEQQRALAEWVAHRVGQTQDETKLALKTDESFLREATETPDKIESRVVGDLAGWEGNAIFTLENGQVWRQRGDERSTRRLSSPRVVIEKNLFGFYILEFLETGQRVRVKRVK